MVYLTLVSLLHILLRVMSHVLIKILYLTDSSEFLGVKYIITLNLGSIVISYLVFTVSCQAWENHLRRNRSIVVDLFHGQLRSQVKCKTCGHVSARFDPFNFLSLPLPMDNSMHLEIIGEFVT